MQDFYHIMHLVCGCFSLFTALLERDLYFVDEVWYKVHFVSHSFFHIFNIHFVIRELNVVSNAACVLKFAHSMHILGISILESNFFSSPAWRT